MPFVSGREILEQIAGTSSVVTLSVCLQKTVGLSMVRNLFCVNSVPLLWHFFSMLLPQNIYVSLTPKPWPIYVVITGSRGHSYH